MKIGIEHREPAVEHRPLSVPKQREAETEAQMQEVLTRRIAAHRARKTRKDNFA